MPRPYLPAPALIILFAVAGPGARTTEAAWPADGVPLCAFGACEAIDPLVCPDGTGGAFVVWGDDRNGSSGTNRDIYAQRVTGSGEIAPGWPPGGLPVCTNPTSQHLLVWSVVPDGLGGALVSWNDFRNTVPGGTSVDIYAHRVLTDGTFAPGWPVDGAPVSRRPGYQAWPVVVADGTGGGYYCWDDLTNPRDIYLQRLSPTGIPQSGWPADGIPVCTASGDQAQPQLAPDGSGGVFVAWGDVRDGTLAVYAQHVLADGSLAPGWPVDGVLIVHGRGMRELVSDGAGGAYLASVLLGPVADDEYYLQRFTGAGTMAAGWPEGGALVCAAPGQRDGLRMCMDGYGGAHLAWYDFRGTSDEIYAMRMQADGTRAPGWPVDGLRVTDLNAGDYSPVPAADGMGGVYLAWDRSTGGVQEIVLQHLSGEGTFSPGWPVNGLVVPGNLQCILPDIAEDGVGGAIAAWARPDGTARALRLGPDGPVAVTLSLVSAEGEPGRVRLVWHAAGAPALVAAVERRAEPGEWERLAELRPDGTGRLAYEDRAVMPGSRYGYRLAYVDEGVERWTAETWVSVPRLDLSLRGFQPNPAVGAATVVFVLGDAAPAQLEVYDVAGRRVASREVGSLGAGRHEVRLDAGARLATGVYALRLTQGGRVLTARGVVTR